MARFLVLYGTVQGQSGKIANFIADELKVMGHTADIFDAESIPKKILPSNYDAYVIGGGVHIGGYPSPLRRWVSFYSRELNKKPGAFFSVCLGILQNDPKVKKEEEQIVQRFFDKTGWHPEFSTIFAGALTYSKYNWFLKRIMRSIAKKASGVKTDMKKDYEYTNWDDVKRFSQECSRKLV